jgi:UDP-glucose 4-epimerase
MITIPQVVKKNHFNNKKVTYLNASTINISKVLNKRKKNIKTIFHFGEFARIYQSFLKMSECIESNSIGTHAVFQFCMKNKIKLIYSATSASLGNNGEDKNLSPYAFTKAKNLELLDNLRKWFNFKFEIVYFYNVYGPRQINKGSMATVIGIFENCYKNKKPLTVVSPGTQSRRFTHIKDTIDVCYEAWRKNKNVHYSISNKKSYSILKVAKLFKTKIKLLPPRKGERFASALTDMNLSNKVYQKFGKIELKDYINSVIGN